jgi:hypothetical protein
MKIGAAFYRNKSRNHFMGIFLTPRPFRDGFCILVLAAIGKISFIRDSVLRLSWTENPLVSSYSPCDLYLNTNQLPVHVLPPASPFPFSPLNPPIYSLSQASNVRVNLKRKLSRFQRITFTFSQSRSKLDMGEMHQREKEIDRCACAFEQVLRGKNSARLLTTTVIIFNQFILRAFLHFCVYLFASLSRTRKRKWRRGREGGGFILVRGYVAPSRTMDSPILMAASIWEKPSKAQNTGFLRGLVQRYSHFPRVGANSP